MEWKLESISDHENTARWQSEHYPEIEKVEIMFRQDLIPISDNCCWSSWQSNYNSRKNQRSMSGKTRFVCSKRVLEMKSGESKLNKSAYLIDTALKKFENVW